MSVSYGMCFLYFGDSDDAVQVFLEPLSKVLGQVRSKTLLLDAARSHTRYLNKLHQMGLLLGITEWRSHFNDKLLLPAPQLPSEIKKVWILFSSVWAEQCFQLDYECTKIQLNDDQFNFWYIYKCMLLNVSKSIQNTVTVFSSHFKYN